MSNLLRHIKNFRINKNSFTKFVINDMHVGWVNTIYVEKLFIESNKFLILDDCLTFHSSLKTVQQKSDVIESISKKLFEQNIVKVWRNELCSVMNTFGGETLFEVERGAALFFGIKAYGVFLNGYTLIENEKYLWIAKRSETKSTYPNKYDCIVAGGITDGLTPYECLVKECSEEASLSSDIVSSATPVGTIDYIRESDGVAENATMFNYDILLPNDFQPMPVDGEVDSFKLLSLPDVLKEIQNRDNFKDNCNLIITDFLIRHGQIDFSYPNYTSICKGLQGAND
jgi:isopentenyldiphosphate isomerase